MQQDTAPKRIAAFKGEFRFLSNFWPCTIELNGYSYPSVEHAYQALKTTDEREREAIRTAPTPGAAKRMGRKVNLRPDFEAKKLLFMEFLVGEKFGNPELRSKLDSTGDAELIEGNSWGDVFWGVCDGMGENHLGKILMKIRKQNRMRMGKCSSN